MPMKKVISSNRPFHYPLCQRYRTLSNEKAYPETIPFQVSLIRKVCLFGINLSSFFKPLCLSSISFMGRSSGYNQIKMHLDDEELQPKELKRCEGGCWFWRCVFVEGRGGETRKFSYNIKIRWWVSLLRRVLWWTGVRRSTHNLIPTKRSTAPLLEYQLRTRQKRMRPHY